MLATPIKKAIIIDQNKTKAFAETLEKNRPTNEYWKQAAQSANSLDMERLYKLYERK